MAKSGRLACRQCRVLAAELAALKVEVARLREELAAARKNSSTSSKPPSSDIVKPKPPGDDGEGTKRKIGGQPGHPLHEREPFPPEQITDFQTHRLDACPDCGGHLRQNGPLEPVVQQLDIQAVPLSVEQHTCPEYWCDHCQKSCWAPLPLPIERGGLVGPNLAALIAFMKGGCHASFSTIRTFLRDVVGVTVQFCLAHLIRDVKFLTTLPDARERAYGERLREALRELFGVIHRRENMSAAAFAKELRAARDWVLQRGLSDVPPTRRAQNMAKRFREHGEAYFTFVTTPEVEPTNNLAERAIRFVVIDRHITQGTRSEAGRQWCERIWTVVATCAQQGRSLDAFLKEAIVNWFHGGEAPSLRPEAAAA